MRLRQSAYRKTSVEQEMETGLGDVESQRKELEEEGVKILIGIVALLLVLVAFFCVLHALAR